MTASRLALLGEWGLPRLRTDVVSYSGAGVLYLGDYSPKTPLPVRMAWLRTWSEVLNQPVVYRHTDTKGTAPWVVGYLQVRTERAGVVVLARAFLTRSEAQGVETLLEADRD